MPGVIAGSQPVAPISSSRANADDANMQLSYDQNVAALCRWRGSLTGPGTRAYAATQSSRKSLLVAHENWGELNAYDNAGLARQLLMVDTPTVVQDRADQHQHG